MTSRQVSISNFPLEGEGSSPLPSHHPYLKRVETEKEKRDFKNIVQTHHSYVPETDFCGRRIQWLVTDRETRQVMGVISLGSAVMAMEDRDRFIGWKPETRRTHLVNIANNTRFCLIEHPPKNFGSQVLSLLCKFSTQAWLEKYGDPLYLIETLVEPPHTGSVYRGAGWREVGKTKGCEYQWVNRENVDEYLKDGWSVSSKRCKYGDVVNENLWKLVRENTGTQKRIFVKPLHQKWRLKLLGG